VTSSRSAADATVGSSSSASVLTPERYPAPLTVNRRSPARWTRS
jgi:hypothetical protein